MLNIIVNVFITVVSWLILYIIDLFFLHCSQLHFTMLWNVKEKKVTYRYTNCGKSSFLKIIWRDSHSIHMVTPFIRSFLQVAVEF